MESLKAIILPTEIAYAINQELYKITRPKSNELDVSKGLFVIVENGDVSAMVADLDYTIVVHPDHNLTRLLTLINSSLTLGQVRPLINYVAGSKSVKFGAIMPPGAEIHDFGWIKENWE